VLGSHHPSAENNGIILEELKERRVVILMLMKKSTSGKINYTSGPMLSSILIKSNYTDTTP